MKNITYQRGLICLSEAEFQRVLSEVAKLESINFQLEQKLKESNARVLLLEDHIRATESEARRASNPSPNGESG